MKKLIFLYSTPRSGSTPVSLALAHYLKEQGYEFFGEYFNPLFSGVREKKGKISIDLHSWAAKEDWGKRSLRQNKEMKKRLSLLQKHEGRSFIKIFPFSFSRKEHLALLSAAEVIYLKRQNLFEQLLSYLVSKTTKKYYESEGLKIKAGELCADWFHFVEFLFTIKALEDDSQLEKKPKILYYEEFILDPKKSLASIGYKNKVDWGQLRLPQKQNQGQKLEFFVNSAEIIAWYKESFLQKRFPI